MTRVLPDRGVWTDLGALLLAWVPAGALGWLLHHYLTDPDATGAVRAGGWLGCVAVAVGVGMLLVRLQLVLLRHRRADVAVRLGGQVAVGWAVATSAGWFLGVEVGGPMTGIVTGVALGACPVLRSGSGRSRVVLVMTIGAVGVVTGWVLAGGGPTGGVGLVVPIAVGLVAVVAAHTALLPALPLGPLVLLVGGWATAWVGAWAVASAFVSPVSLGLSIVAEIGLAMGVGGAVVGVVHQRVTGEAAWAVALRWGVAAAGGVAVGTALATGLRALLGGEFTEHLDVGTAVGLGVAAWFAVLPTLRALRRPRPDAAR